MVRLFSTLMLCILLVSCNKDEAVIPSEFATYLDRFVNEAKLRGKTISLDKLEVRFKDLENNCGLAEIEPLRVNIDEACWNRMPDVAKELLMFHELGHALLRLNHDDGTLPNGDYKSIMVPDPTVLYNDFTLEKRVYYLDELFGVLKGLPAWTALKTNEYSVIDDNITLPTAWAFISSNGALHEGEVIDSVYYSAENCLAIKSNGTSSGFSYWRYQWTPQGIEMGDEVVLKLKIKSEGLTNGGAYFAFRADIQGEEFPVFFYTTQGDPVLGTNDFKEYSVKVNYFPSMIEQLNIFLILDGSSTGTVYFDDIQVLKYN